MKARVKATGKIVEVVEEGIQNSNMVMTAYGEWFTKDELDIVPLSWKPFEPTYWQKLEHTYAGMAMQGILGNQTYTKHLLETSTSAKDARDIIVDASWYLAHALVEKMKEANR